MKNFLHHYEYEKSGLKTENIEELIKEKKALYNYGADQRENKWSNNSQLIKTSLNLLPKHISDNIDNLKDWID